MTPPGFAAIILAAGEGTRMKSALPKVLHEIAGRPMIRASSSRRCSRSRRPRRSSSSAATWTRSRAPSRRAEPSIQYPPRGTGDAVRTALRALDGRLAPQGEHRRRAGALRRHAVSHAPRRLPRCSRSGAAQPERRSRSPACGRPIPAPMAGSCSDRTARSSASSRRRTPAPRSGRSGCAMAASWRSRRATSATVDALGNDNAKREFYLTDIVAHRAPQRAALPRRRAAGRGAARRQHPRRARRGRGADAAPAAPRARWRRASTLVAPETVFLCADTRLGRDVVVEPNVIFGPGVTVADGARIRSFSHLEGADGRGGRDGRAVRPAAPRRGARRGRACRQFRRGQGDPARRRRQGQSPLLYRRQRHRRAAPISAPARSPAITTALTNSARQSARARLSARTRRWSRRSRSATAPIVAAGSVVTRDVPADALSIARGRQVDKPGRAAEIAGSATEEES